MKTFLFTVVLITLVIVNANGAPSVDAEEILDNKSLLEQMLDVLNEEKAEAEVRNPCKEKELHDLIVKFTNKIFVITLDFYHNH